MKTMCDDWMLNSRNSAAGAVLTKLNFSIYFYLHCTDGAGRMSAESDFKLIEFTWPSISYEFYKTNTNPFNFGLRRVTAKNMSKWTTEKKSLKQKLNFLITTFQRIESFGVCVCVCEHVIKGNPHNNIRQIMRFVHFDFMQAK